jgi:hypothetical protein
MVLSAILHPYSIEAHVALPHLNPRPHVSPIPVIVSASMLLMGDRQRILVANDSTNALTIT